jgi:hypothetical protein
MTATLIIRLTGKPKQVAQLPDLLCKVQGNKRICEIRGGNELYKGRMESEG